MRLSNLRIRNFRCFRDVTIEVGSMHAIVGANNAGKSTILKALDFLFNPSTRKVDEEAFCGKSIDGPIEIEGTFTDLTTEEAEQLKAYTCPDGTFRLKRSASYVPESKGGDNDDTGAEVKIVAHYCTPQPSLGWLIPSCVSTRSIAEWWDNRDSLVVNEISFIDFASWSMKPGVSDWKEKASEFVAKYGHQLDFEDTWTANPQGYANVLKATLPHFVLIPAVRDAADESKITKTSPLGQLIYEVIRTMDGGLRSSIEEKLKESTRLLNREGDADRAQGVIKVEATIKEFLNEVMAADLELEFQAPTVDVVLTTPKIYVDDGFRGSVEGKGHGLQRAVIFAILRAYASLVTERPDADRKRLILGVEEPELYMHPTAQRTIRKALRSIADNGDQVLFCTHSPLLVDVAYFDEIIRCENPEPGVGEMEAGRARPFQLSMESMMKDFNARNPSRAADANEQSMRERYSHAYTLSRNEGFFAKRVILVEGATEAYALPIYSTAMNFDLDALAISVIECGNKASIDRLYRIFNELGIACYVLFDYDKDNSQSERRRESKGILKLLGQPDADTEATTKRVHEKYAYFINTWESDLTPEIPGYAGLMEEARSTLGVRDSGKPLVARYVARNLSDRVPPLIPPTIKAIIENAVKVKCHGTCLASD